MLQVIAAVIKRADRYLICRRALNKRHGGLWEFPGGKLEFGETLFDAAKRELLEELEMHVTAAGATLFSAVDDASSFAINFVEIAAEGEPILVEHIDSRWATISELGMMQLAPVDKLFVERLRQ